MSSTNETPSNEKKPRLISSWLLNVLALVIVFAIATTVFWPPRDHMESARRSSCSSNLKQIGLAMMQYSQEYDDHFPQRTTGLKANGELASWRDLLDPYLKSRDLWKCPSNAASKSDANALDGWPLGYDIVLGQIVRNGQPLSLQQVKSPASTIMVFEENGDNAQTRQIGAPWDKDDGDADWTNILFAGHLNTSNYLFADGHVRAFRPLRTFENKINQWNIDNRAPVPPRALQKLNAAQKNFD